MRRFSSSGLSLLSGPSSSEIGLGVAGALEDVLENTGFFWSLLRFWGCEVDDLGVLAGEDCQFWAR
jgi:hypothetical protein